MRSALRQFVVSWGVVCALALGGSPCVESAEVVGTAEHAEAPAQAKAEMLPVFVEHPEPIRYAYRPVLYVNNFAQATLPTEAALRAPGGPVDQVRDRVYAHMQHLNRASKGLLQPSFDGVVTLMVEAAGRRGDMAAAAARPIPAPAPRATR